MSDTDCLSVLSLSNDMDMEVDHFTNGVTESSSNGFLNGSSKHTTEPDDCDADMGGLRVHTVDLICVGTESVP